MHVLGQLHTFINSGIAMAIIVNTIFSHAVRCSLWASLSSCADLPEELKVQAGLGQEELIILLKPHLAHSSILKHTHTHTLNMRELRMLKQYKNKKYNKT